jgi:hypothetical protein
MHAVACVSPLQCLRKQPLPYLVLIGIYTSKHEVL